MKRALTLFIMAAMPASAMAFDETRVAGWRVYPSGDVCAMGTVYEDDTAFLVRQSASRGRVVLAFESREATSRKDGEKVRLNVLAYSSPSAHSGKAWDDIEFTVQVGDDGVRQFVSAPVGDKVLDDIAKHRTLSFFYGENLVKTLKLDGTARALRAFRTCASEVARLDPRDPFVK